MTYIIWFDYYSHHMVLQSNGGLPMDWVLQTYKIVPTAPLSGIPFPLPPCKLKTPHKKMISYRCMEAPLRWVFKMDAATLPPHVRVNIHINYKCNKVANQFSINFYVQKKTESFQKDHWSHWENLTQTSSLQMITGK